MQTNLQNDFRPKFDFNTLLENKQNGVANEVGGRLFSFLFGQYYIIQMSSDKFKGFVFKSTKEYAEKGSLLIYFQEFQRIDGGSDSPTPNDDASVHSVSDNGFDQDSTLKQVHSLSCLVCIC